MPFEVIPALDIAGGKLVRIDRGRQVRIGAFGGDPLGAARAFVAAGARRLHVVDVDLASTGEPSAPGILEAVAALGVPVQASGGVASATHIETLLEAGASRVVLGSGALRSRPGTEELVMRFGAALVVGIEVDGGWIHPRGGGDPIPLWETVAWVDRLEVPGYVLTQVGRVGGLDGPDQDAVREIAARTQRPVIAAGGIRGPEDIRALASIGAPVQGAILGRALYEGLDLREALAAAPDRER